MCAAAKRKIVSSSHHGALRLLLSAYDAALESRKPPREFAVELKDFGTARGMATTLRRLVSRGFVEHLIESTSPAAQHGTFRVSRRLRFGPRSCFMLTAAGLRLARRQTERRRAKDAQQAETPGQTADVPHWDQTSKRLRHGEIVVKRFPRPAPNQECVLAAFEEEGWPPHIYDPLPPRAGTDPKQRLHDTIYKLNQHQQNPLIHFYGDGTGQGVCWECRKPF